MAASGLSQAVASRPADRATAARASAEAAASASARTVSTRGFIAPTMQFITGVAFGEALPPLSLAAFGLIWTGVAVYAFSAWRKLKAGEPIEAN